MTAAATPRIRRILGALLGALGLLLAVAAGLAFWALRHSDPPMPALSGRIESGAAVHDGRRRSWLAYLPADRAPSPALVVVLHASMGSAPQAREVFGYDFDLLADREGFVVAYPDGVEGHWNDARVKGPFAAKRDNVNDAGFLRVLVDAFVERYGVDRTRVYAVGVSNGGSMVLRLALETPRLARAYAVVAASVPAPQNLAVVPRNEPVSILFMNGTDDPLNPWDGGDVVLLGVWGNRGKVLSTRAGVEWFCALAGLDAPPEVVAVPDRDSSDGSTVERSLWSVPGKPRVALYTVKGGGHQVPHPASYGRRLLGRSNRDVHTAREIWQFFRSVS